MLYQVVKRVRGKKSGKTYKRGTLIDYEPEKASRLIEAGKIRPVQSVVEQDLDNAIVQRFRQHTRLLEALPSIKGSEVYEEIQTMIEQLFVLTDEREVCQKLDTIEGIYQEHLKFTDLAFIVVSEIIVILYMCSISSYR